MRTRSFTADIMPDHRTGNLPLPRRNHRPSWAVTKEFVFVEIAGARSHDYKFYRRTGNGRVY